MIANDLSSQKPAMKRDVLYTQIMKIHAQILYEFPTNQISEYNLKKKNYIYSTNEVLREYCHSTNCTVRKVKMQIADKWARASQTRTHTYV